jgi:hypothetical protein
LIRLKAEKILQTEKDKVKNYGTPLEIIGEEQ